MKREEILKIAEEYLESLQRRAEQLKEEIFIRQQEYNRLHNEIKSLKWFIKLDEQESETVDELLKGSAPSKVYGPSEIKDEIAKILAEVYPGTLHYSKVMERLNERGFYIGGKNPMQNLLSYLSRDDRFIRGEKRGEYHLNINGDVQKTIA